MNDEYAEKVTRLCNVLFGMEKPGSAAVEVYNTKAGKYSEYTLIEDCAAFEVEDENRSPLLINNDDPVSDSFDADQLGELVSKANKFRKNGGIAMNPDIINGGGILKAQYTISKMSEEDGKQVMYTSEFSINEKLENIPKGYARVVIYGANTMAIVIKELTESDEFTDEDLFDMILNLYDYDAYYNSTKRAAIFVQYSRLIYDGKFFFERDLNTSYVLGNSTKETV